MPNRGRLFNASVEGESWSLIHSLHAGAFCRQARQSLLRSFECGAGARQSGILSTDLYKLHVYANGLLDKLQMLGVGCHIGEISCVTTACADDVAILGPVFQNLTKLLANVTLKFLS